MSLDSVAARPAVARTRVSIDAAGGAVVRLWRAWRMRARQRREASALTARDLADIGVTRAEIERALAKPFWRP